MFILACILAITGVIFLYQGLIYRDFGLKRSSTQTHCLRHILDFGRLLVYFGADLREEGVLQLYPCWVREAMTRPLLGFKCSERLFFREKVIIYVTVFRRNKNRRLLRLFITKTAIVIQFGYELKNLLSKPNYKKLGL